MANPNQTKQPDPPDPAEQVQVPFAGETQFQPGRLPPSADPGKQIHPRRPMPLVPEAVPVDASNKQVQQQPPGSKSE